ncbi:hypothetical protein [Rhizobium sp. P44RR-XXIV]|uniref:hypothetical protein n=1 Tax=Rhizobium sp. P44RR-XXIV TaxID=1921145 RepID=UPI00145A08C2|nr:hypothetical protein [Rhizobium sp. P44RR-XXIV]
MTSHDNGDNILTDQKLHDLLKAEDEMDRVTESKQTIPDESELLPDEASQVLIS